MIIVAIMILLIYSQLNINTIQNKDLLSKFLSEISLNWPVPVDNPQAAPQAYHTVSIHYLSFLCAMIFLHSAFWLFSFDFRFRK